MSEPSAWRIAPCGRFAARLTCSASTSRRLTSGKTASSTMRRSSRSSPPSGNPPPDFGKWDESRRLEFLNRELESPRPFLYHGSSIGDQADAVLECYAVLRRHLRNYGRDGIGALIVSMTRQLSDLLVVYLLAREAGLMRWTPEGLLCTLPVVPLFETLDDLERSADSDRCLPRASGYETQSRVSPDRPREGPLPSAYQARPTGHDRVQRQQQGLRDSRQPVGAPQSAGRHRFRRRRASASRSDFSTAAGAQSAAAPDRPTASSKRSRMARIQGDIRLTEQGETIAQKFANLVTATYNLELLLAGVTGFTVKEQREPPPAPRNRGDLRGARRLEPTGLLKAHQCRGFHDLLLAGHADRCA